jgi:hypothetical protein
VPNRETPNEKRCLTAADKKIAFIQLAMANIASTTMQIIHQYCTKGNAWVWLMHKKCTPAYFSASSAIELHMEALHVRLARTNFSPCMVQIV